MKVESGTKRKMNEIYARDDWSYAENFPHKMFTKFTRKGGQSPWHWNHIEMRKKSHISSMRFLGFSSKHGESKC